MEIRLEQLSIGYGREKVVVSDINVSIRSNELTCLIGTNGIGKSTLLKTLTGFLPPLSGRILLDGQNIGVLSQSERAKLMSIVLTNRMETQNLSVMDMVGMGRMPYTGFWGKLGKADEKKVQSAIKSVGIGRLRERMVHDLSDGERQKVMIAKAIAQETPIIYLDEPTAFLDFQSKVEILLLLKRMAKELHKIVFLSTHDLELAVRIADLLVELTTDGLHTVSAERVKMQIEGLLNNTSSAVILPNG